MPDILFNCSRCTQSLVVDTAGIGLTIPCPTCGFSLVIPSKGSPPPVAPEVTVPEVTVSKTRSLEPTVPKTATVQATVPEAKTSEISIPKSTVPEMTIPQAKAPETVLPKAAAPESIVPKETVPEVKVPDAVASKATATAPKSTVSKATVPDNFRPKDEDFNLHELIDMLFLYAMELECEIDGDAVALIARSSNGNPEDAKKRLRRVLAYGRSGTVALLITMEVAAEGLKVFVQENQRTLPPKGKF